MTAPTTAGLVEALERLETWASDLDNSAEIALRKPELASTGPRVSSYRRHAADLRTLIAAARAYQAQSAVPAPGGEDSGWLIEHALEPKWWTGWPGPNTDDEFWTTDSLKAIRFGRQWDAEEFARLNLGDGDYRVTDHAWTMGPRAAPPAPAASGWRDREAEQMALALEKATAWFEDYERQHLAKGTAEGKRKADTNRTRADYCARSVIAWRAPSPPDTAQET